MEVVGVGKVDKGGKGGEGRKKDRHGQAQKKRWKILSRLTSTRKKTNDDESRRKHTKEDDRRQTTDDDIRLTRKGCVRQPGVSQCECYGKRVRQSRLPRRKDKIKTFNQEHITLFSGPLIL